MYHVTKKYNLLIKYFSSLKKIFFEKSGFKKKTTFKLCFFIENIKNSKLLESAYVRESMKNNFFSLLLFFVCAIVPVTQMVRAAKLEIFIKCSIYEQIEENFLINFNKFIYNSNEHIDKRLYFNIKVNLE